jgi:proteasome lid subunit RPN8/RPN11
VQTRSTAKVAAVLAASQNPVIARIGELLKGIASTVGIRKWDQALIRKYKPKGTWAAFYAGGEDIVAFRDEANPGSLGRGYEDAEKTVAHEFAHALTVYSIDNPTPSQRPHVQQLKKLYAHIVTLAKQNQYGLRTWAGGGDYGTADIYEMVAEGWSNPTFQYKLKQIPYGDSTLWGKFVRFVAGILGFKDSNALTELLELSEKIARTKQKGIKPARASDRVYAAEDETQAPPAGGRGPAGNDGAGVTARPAGAESAGLTAREDAAGYAPFYSELARALQGLTTKSAPADGWKQAIKGLVAKGTVQADEVEWTGINEWLDLQQGKVTREALAEYLDANGVRVAETVLDDIEAGGQRDIDGEVFNATVDRPTQYGAYRAALDGGEPGSYRELLLTLPVSVPTTDTTGWTAKITRARTPINNMPEMTVYDAAGGELSKQYTGDPQQAIEWAARAADRAANREKTYSAPHFGQEHGKNLLAHVRFDVRRGAAGQRVLFLHEVQSDWGQTGAKKEDTGPAKGQRRGFKGDAPVYEVRRANYEGNPDLWAVFDTRTNKPVPYEMPFSDRAKADKNAADRNDSAEKMRPPRAPFVTNTDAWAALVLKRMVKYAVDNGLDSIALPTGQQMVEQFDLAKHIGKVEYVEGKLVAYAPDGREVSSDRVDPTVEEIAPYIGQEPAQRLVDKIEQAKATAEYDRRQWDVVEDQDEGGYYVTDPNGEPFYSDGGDLEHYATEDEANAAIDEMIERDGRGFRAEPPTLDALDLRVGGEGQRQFYDAILPKLAARISKKLGGDGVAKQMVETRQPYDAGRLIPAEDAPGRWWLVHERTQQQIDGPFETDADANEARQRLYLHAEAGRTPQNAITITDKMREMAATGVPLFAKQPPQGYSAADGQDAGDGAGGGGAGGAGAAAGGLPVGVRGDGGQVRGDRARITGLGIAERIERTGHAALNGSRVGTAQDLADLAQVFRDPRYETFRVFFVKGNTIVHSTGISSRTVSGVSMVPAGMTQAEYVTRFKAMMASTGADGYYLLHNHPSGDPTPSRADQRMTADLQREAPGLLAHVIVNSNKYGVLQPLVTGGMDEQVHIRYFGEEKLLQASKPLAVIGRALSGSDDLAVLGKAVQKPGYVTLIGTDAGNKVRVVTEVPSSQLGRSDRHLLALLRRMKRLSGSQSMHAVGSNADIASDPIQRALSAGLLRDALPETGQAASVQGIPGGPKADIESTARELGVADPLANNYKGLEGGKVAFPVRIEDTGQEATITLDAAVAMRDYDDRLGALRRLVECLA